jgi:hypothetical protein
LRHWTEPNGIFIINVPIEWQYINVIVKEGKEEPPYSFEPSEEGISSFQLSCYPLKEKGINPNLLLQKNNSEVEWALSQLNDEKFKMHLFGAQVDDQLCFAKYIYSKSEESNPTIKTELKKVQEVLKTFRLIPASDRKLASNLSKYDNFIGSLGASYDLLYKAIESESFIELVVISSNQIDAFLRLSIILHKQNSSKTNEIETKYLFQNENERGIIERKIYNEAHGFGIIDDDLNKELNGLYDLRNRVIHRYIISSLKTRDIIEISGDYLVIHEKVRLILKGLEQQQAGMGFGIYGQGLKSIDDIDEVDKRRLYAFANDKHLYDKLKRKL